MSLRAEIRAAIDDVTPPAPALQQKVVAYVMAGERDRVVRLHRPRNRWTRSFRGPMTLVAAALLVVLIGGLVLGGRLLRDMNAPPQGINQAQLKSLESRPVHLPTVQPGAECPTSPLTDLSAHGPQAFLLGEGPVYSTRLAYRNETTNWGTWYVLSLTVDTTTASGPILIRGEDLQTHAQVLFARAPLSPGYGFPAGTVVRTDVLGGVTTQLYPEAVLDLTRPYEGTKKGDWPVYKSTMGYPKAATGCIGLQVDGAGFTEHLVIN